MRRPAGSPMIWLRGTGAGGSCWVQLFSGPSHVRCYPVRAVPLAAFIPSRDPGRGRGAWGGSVSEGRSGGVNQMAALPPAAGQNSLRPRAWRGAECLATSRLAAGPGSVGHAARAGWVMAGSAGGLARQRICPSRIPQKTRVRSRRAAATLAMLRASLPLSRIASPFVTEEESRCWPALHWPG